MDYQGFAGAAQAAGLRVVDNYAFGEYMGPYVYPFAVIAPKTQKAINSLVLQVRLGQTMTKKVWKPLRKAIKGMGTLVQTTPLNEVRFIATGKNEDMFNKVFTVLNTLMPMVIAQGLTPPTTCPICGASHPMDSEAFVGGAYVPVHRVCLEQKSYQGLNEIEANKSKGGNRWLGILGAVIGAIIGCIPTLLLMLLLQRISAWLYALIPLASYYGYKKMKGIMDKSVLPLVIVLTILSTIFIEQVYFYCLVHDYYGIWPYFHETVAYYFEVMTFGEIMGDLAMPLLFAVLGIFISWGVIRQNNVTFENDIHFSLRTLFVRMPYAQNVAGMNTASEVTMATEPVQTAPMGTAEIEQNI